MSLIVKWAWFDELTTILPKFGRKLILPKFGRKLFLSIFGRTMLLNVIHILKDHEISSYDSVMNPKQLPAWYS